MTDGIKSSFEFRSWVQLAVSVAMHSHCQSKRGVVIFSHDGHLISDGFNYQPRPFRCDGSASCKNNCGKTAIHAEQAAILNAKTDLNGLWMIHVKAKGGNTCASGAPSCLECSKLILNCGISWMHLIHDPGEPILIGSESVGQIEGYRTDGIFDFLDIRRYSSDTFHRLTIDRVLGSDAVDVISDAASKAHYDR